MKKLLIVFYALFMFNSYAESIVWNKENNFCNWTHFFNVKGKVENGILKLYDIKFDPQISNRAVDIDPKKFDTLVYVCKINGSGPKKTGEFYFWPAGGKANPRQAWRLPKPICDGEYHTYTVRGQELSAWLECGTISGIRLDITNSAGGDIEISEIRLEKSPGTSTTEQKKLSVELVWNKENNFKPWKHFRHCRGEIANGLISFTEIQRDCSIATHNLTEINPMQYNTLSYTYRAEGTGDRGGQFFFRSGQDKFSDKARIFLPKLIADGQWHTIECRLDVPAWENSGKVTGLRLDPTDSAGGHLDISEIKLLKKVYPAVSVAKKAASAVAPPIGRLDAPRWQPVKSELWKQPPANTNISTPLKYYQGAMIRSPQDICEGSQYQDFYLRKSFELVKTPVLGFLQFIADDCAQAFINGKEVGNSNDWRSGVCVDISKYLKQGKNILGFHYVNSSTYGGVLAELYVQYADGSSERINSDKTFKSSVMASDKWNEVAFDDTAWDAAIEQPAPPAAPWKAVIPYRYFSNMQKVLLASVVPREVEAGKKITFILQFARSGKPPEEAFQLDVILRRGSREFLRDKITLSSQNIVRQDHGEWQLKFDYLIHPWCPDGQFEVFLDSDVFSIGGKTLELAVKRLSCDPDWQHKIKFQVNRSGMRPFFELNGKPFHPCWGNSHGITPAHWNLVSVYPKSLIWQTASGCIDTDEFDRTAIMTQRRHPEAYFIWDLRLDISREWAERFPQELCRDENNQIISRGGHVCYSFSSELALQEIENNMVRAIEYLENSPYANRIIGYRITGGYTSEWLGWVAGNGKALDFSNCAVNAYKKFATENYPQLKNPYVPTAAERQARDGKALLFDQQKHLNLIAYNDFTSHAVAEMMIYLCRKAKAIVGPNKVIGTYYGYVSTLNYTGQAHHRAHFALKMVLDAGVIDFLMSPQSYYLRGLGESCGDMKPFGTLQKKGIIPVLENDTRTHCGFYDAKTSGGRYQMINEYQTINAFRRDMIMTVIRCQPSYMISLLNEHVQDFPAMAVEIEFLKILGEWCLNKHVERSAEIALVVSEETIKAMPRIRELAYSGITDQSYRGDGTVRTESRRKPVLNFETFIGNQGLFNRSGAVVDQLLAEDFADNPGNYKLYVFLNCYKYDEKFLQAVAGLQKKKCVLLWLYAPGFFKGLQGNVENMLRLTGIQFEKISEPQVASVQFADKRIMGTPQAQVTPLFAVNDPVAEVLARYDSGKVGVAMKKQGNAVNIFSGAWQLDMDFIAFLLTQAGIFQYSQSYDPLDASDNLIMIHARNSGGKTIKLPRKSDVLDVYDQKIIARNVDSFNTELKLHETKCFYYGSDVDGLLANLKKIKNNRN